MKETVKSSIRLSFVVGVGHPRSINGNGGTKVGRTSPVADTF